MKIYKTMETLSKEQLKKIENYLLQCDNDKIYTKFTSKNGQVELRLFPTCKVANEVSGQFIEGFAGTANILGELKKSYNNLSEENRLIIQQSCYDLINEQLEKINKQFQENVNSIEYFLIDYMNVLKNKHNEEIK